MKLLKSPLFQFLVIGVIVYLILSMRGKDAEVTDARTVVIPASEVEWMKANWEKRWMRPPTDEELDGQIQQYIKENVLYREALALGLDKNDPLIRRQLAMKLERMVQDLAMAVEPTDVELEAYFTENAEKYRTPELVTMTQVFFDPDQRGDATVGDAEAVMEKLQALESPAEDAKEFGDSFMLQGYFPERSESDIAKVLGRGFAGSVMPLETGVWHGPVLSGYGVHLVYLHGRVAPSLPEFASLKDTVKQDYLIDTREAFKAKYIAELLASYEVVLEEEPAGEAVAQ